MRSRFMELESGLFQADLNRPYLLKGGHRITNPPDEVKFFIYFLPFAKGWIFDRVSASSLASIAISSAAS